MGTNTPSFARVFSEKDEIVLLQGVIDSKGENPLRQSLTLRIHEGFF